VIRRSPVGRSGPQILDEPSLENLRGRDIASQHPPDVIEDGYFQGSNERADDDAL
jgi:hypothetical protein